MKKNKKNGFTLFELLVSISIIGILTALASVAFSGAQKKARDARRMQDIKLVQTASEQFYSQNTYLYPANTTTPWMGGTQEILSVFPTDPKNDADTGFVYTYTPSVDRSTYCVCAFMENGANANSGNNCDFAAANKTYFCAKNQQ